MEGAIGAPRAPLPLRDGAGLNDLAHVERVAGDCRFCRTFAFELSCPLGHQDTCKWLLAALRHERSRLLLDSRVVDWSMAHTPTFVILSSLKPFFFNRLQSELRFLDNVGA